MRMYTMHFGMGMEHTKMFRDQARGNLPYSFVGWQSGVGAVDEAYAENCQIVSHKEIFDRYGVTGGHGAYCLETWTHSNTSRKAGYSCMLHTGGNGAVNAEPGSIRAFYLKFDFMYTHELGGDVIVLQRSQILGTKESRDLTISLVDGYLQVQGIKHITQPDTNPPSYMKTAWLAREDGRFGTIQLEPNKWHEIQVFINPAQGWDTSEVGPDPIGLGYYVVDVFMPFFSAYEINPNTPPLLYGAESSNPEYPLQMDQWPANGHPQFPNTMLPGDDQTVWPPANYASGQYFYPANLGLVYVWVNGKLDIQHTTNMFNEQSSQGWLGENVSQKVYLGYTVAGSNENNNRTARFFFDNIIYNDIRDPSQSYPSKIFDPMYSSHASLEWNPKYSLKFTAMEIDPEYWDYDAYGIPNGRKHNTWMPEYPRGALVPSGDPYWVAAPNRFGAPTNGMIPHGTKLTVVHLDWDGELQDYIVQDGNRNLYPDYEIDYGYQHIHPNESNPFYVNQDDPRLRSNNSGNKALFYLKRPPAASGKQPMAGGYGLGGVKNYVPNINADIGETSLPVIYRIWTCVQDHVIGASEPIDHQHHMIRVPSGVSGHVDYISDHWCPGDRGARAYHNGTASNNNGYSMADWPYNPVTGEPWTWDDLDAIQVGVSHEWHKGSNRVLTYTMFVVVEHASPIDPEVSILGTNLIEWAVADDIPFFMQKKAMYQPGWRFYDVGSNYRYYNRWDISPAFAINRSNRQSTDGEATITNPQYSGTIDYEYKIRYINGEVIQGANYRKFDEYFPKVWVYTIDNIIPDNPMRNPFRGEVITDANGDYFTFLTYPVLEWNTKRYPTDHDLSPLDRYPYVHYDYNTLYVIPLHTHNVATSIDPDEVHRTWTDPNTPPAISGSLGNTWKINKQQNAFNFQIDPDSYFKTFSPSSVMNHMVTHPNENIDTTYPVSRTGHDYYFQAPDLASGSVMQTILLTDKLGVPEEGIDHELYDAHIGLYQTTVNQAINDTGEGRFDFYSGNPGADTFISGYTFGPDGTAGWHLNEANITIPSGTRQVRFMFTAIRNTVGPKSPGGTLGGTSNFAAFDEPFFIINMGSGYFGNSYHPADTNQDSRIGSRELAQYIGMWQSGILPMGVAKDYLTRAERIWQSGYSTFFGDPSGGRYTDHGGSKPERWMGSGYV